MEDDATTYARERIALQRMAVFREALGDHRAAAELLIELIQITPASESVEPILSEIARLAKLSKDHELLRTAFSVARDRCGIDPAERDRHVARFERLVALAEQLRKTGGRPASSIPKEASHLGARAGSSAGASQSDVATGPVADEDAARVDAGLWARRLRMAMSVADRDDVLHRLQDRILLVGADSVPGPLWADLASFFSVLGELEHVRLSLRGLLEHADGMTDSVRDAMIQLCARCDAPELAPNLAVLGRFGPGRAPLAASVRFQLGLLYASLEQDLPATGCFESIEPADAEYLAARIRLLEIYGRRSDAEQFDEERRRIRDSKRDPRDELPYLLAVGRGALALRRDREATTAFLDALRWSPTALDAARGLLDVARFTERSESLDQALTQMFRVGRRCQNHWVTFIASGALVTRGVAGHDEESAYASLRYSLRRRTARPFCQNWLRKLGLDLDPESGSTADIREVPIPADLSQPFSESVRVAFAQLRFVFDCASVRLSASSLIDDPVAIWSTPEPLVVLRRDVTEDSVPALCAFYLARGLAAMLLPDGASVLRETTPDRDRHQALDFVAATVCGDPVRLFAALGAWSLRSQAILRFLLSGVGSELASQLGFEK